MIEEYDVLKVVSVEDVDVDTLSNAELLNRYMYWQTIAAMTQKDNEKDNEEVNVEHRVKTLREIILNKMASK